MYEFILLLAFFVAVALIGLLVTRYRQHLRKKAVRRSFETWAIGIYEGTSPVQLHSPSDIANPVLTASDVSDVRARFVADPFMIRVESGYYMFFEVLNDRRNLGEIGYASSPDGKEWQYRSIVLRERFHLSYPYVFSSDGHYYMIPECGASGGIHLYRAVEFPERWERISTIIRGDRERKAVVDPSVIRHGGHWYLFSYGKHRSLHLFVSESLAGPWVEHPKSPVISGTPQFARPGGRVVAHEGCILRYAQDETPHYGSRVWAFRIVELTPTAYREAAASDKPVLEPGNESWNRDGMHNVDPHQQASGTWLACVDGFTIHSAKE
ncbi:MAG: hypothetical protein HGB02_04910 [Chlorobiaceae bacterium]|nr:hypothetical protein [Chlorobiaceae bacterium]